MKELVIKKSEYLIVTATNSLYIINSETRKNVASINGK